MIATNTTVHSNLTKNASSEIALPLKNEVSLYKCHGIKLWHFINKGKTDSFWVMMCLHIFEPEHKNRF